MIKRQSSELPRPRRLVRVPPTEGLLRNNTGTGLAGGSSATRYSRKNTFDEANCVSVTECKTYLAGLDDVDVWVMLIKREDRPGFRFGDNLLIAPSAVKVEMEDARRWK